MTKIEEFKKEMEQLYPQYDFSKCIYTKSRSDVIVIVPEYLDGRSLLIRDDLCDGGGTFVGIAEAIKKVQPDSKISIYIDHMVNPKGIENLSKTFDHV